MHGAEDVFVWKIASSSELRKRRRQEATAEAKIFAVKSDTRSENAETDLDGGTRYLHVLHVPASNVRFSGGRWEQKIGALGRLHEERT